MDGVPAGRDWHADRGHAHWRQPALVTGCHSVPGPTSRCRFGTLDSCAAVAGGCMQIIHIGALPVPPHCRSHVVACYTPAEGGGCWNAPTRLESRISGGP